MYIHGKKKEKETLKDIKYPGNILQLPTWRGYVCRNDIDPKVYSSKKFNAAIAMIS